MNLRYLLKKNFFPLYTQTIMNSYFSGYEKLIYNHENVAFQPQDLTTIQWEIVHKRDWEMGNNSLSFYSLFVATHCHMLFSQMPNST